MQELIEGALEAEPYFMKVSSDPGLQNTKTELNEIVTVYADIIHDDHTSSC